MPTKSQDTEEYEKNEPRKSQKSIPKTSQDPKD
jgi:hypothetical protein